ncbi:MAG: histidine kinase, partial [Flavobacterium sp.]|nr:histidine kinase [Flavobacterium sp.]
TPNSPNNPHNIKTNLNLISFKIVVPNFILDLTFISCSKQNITTKDNDYKQAKKWFDVVIDLRYNNYFKIKNYVDSLSVLSKTTNKDEIQKFYWVANGIYLHRLGNEKESFKNYHQAYQELQKKQNDTLSFYTFSGLGNYYKTIGDYTNAIKYLLDARKTAEFIKSIDYENAIDANLGQVYFQKGDEKNAKILSQNVVQNSKIKTNAAYLIAQHTLANMFGMAGDFDKALQIDAEGIMLSDAIKSNDLKVTFLDNKANCYMYSNRLDSANFYFNKCLELDLKNKNINQIADTYTNLAQLSLFKKDNQALLENVAKSLKISRENDYKYGELKNLQLLIDFYQSQNNYNKAFETSQEYQKVYKQYISDKRELAEASYKITFETEKKERIILENEIQLDKFRNRLYLTILIAFILAMLGFLFVYKQKMAAKQQEQEFKLNTAIKEIETQNKLHEQRLTISRDLHDNIGAQLTFIISSIDNIYYAFPNITQEIKIQLTKISDFSKETISELRDTIWALNKDQFTLDSLNSRILNFIENAKNVKSTIDFEVEIDTNNSNKEIDSLVGINLYRCVQEAINNALKYSDASKIKFTITEQNNHLDIKIIENGKGFNIDEIDFGNGLMNIKKRMEEIKGEAIIDSKISEGTSIILKYQYQII